MRSYSNKSDGISPNPLLKLWSKRVGAFWREAAPYFSYVARGGFVGFLFLLVIVGGFGYRIFLQQVPSDFPFLAVAVVLLTPHLAMGRVRTFLQQADIVYWLPFEARMTPYFRLSALYSFIPQWLRASAVVIVLWPLYAKLYGGSGGVQAGAFLLVWGAVTLLKALNLYGDWQQNRMVWIQHRVAYGLIRFAATAVSVLALFWNPTWKSLVFIGLACLAFSLALRLPPRLNVAWERLMVYEERSRSRYYRFFSWFADVPQLPANVKRRTWLVALIPKLKFRQDRAYLFLYIKTLIRTELLSMVLRLTLIGAIAVVVFDTGWMQGIVYVLFLYFTGIQLSALEREHRYMFWMQLYPIPETLRRRSILRVTYAAHLTVAIMMFVPLALTAASPVVWLLSLLAGALFTYGFHHVWLRRKWSKMSETD